MNQEEIRSKYEKARKLKKLFLIFGIIFLAGGSIASFIYGFSIGNQLYQPGITYEEIIQQLTENTQFYLVNFLTSIVINIGIAMMILSFTLFNIRARKYKRMLDGEINDKVVYENEISEPKEDKKDDDDDNHWTRNSGVTFEDDDK